MRGDSRILQCCIGCRLEPTKCVCGDAPRLAVSTRLIVIVHSKEWRRSTNTGYLARLATQSGEVRFHGLPHRPVDGTGVDASSRSTLVLFPGRGAEPLTSDYLASLPRPLTLLVPDGNWSQAKNMMRRVPMLSQARPVRLEEARLRPTQLRDNPCAGHMSTFEAIAQALGILEGKSTEERLLLFFSKVLAGMVQNHRRAYWQNRGHRNRS